MTKPCHFGVVSYEMTASPLAAEASGWIKHAAMALLDLYVIYI